MPRAIRFHLEGQPIPQGSLTGGKGRGLHYSNRSELLAYRKRIRIAATEGWGAEPSTLPISVIAIFAMRRPLRHYSGLNWRLSPKYADVRYQTNIPDIDKLLRAVLDAMTGVVYRDDAQVAKIEGRKIFSDAWGTTIHVRELGHMTLWETIEYA